MDGRNHWQVKTDPDNWLANVIGIKDCAVQGEWKLNKSNMDFGD